MALVACAAIALGCGSDSPPAVHPPDLPVGTDLQAMDLEVSLGSLAATARLTIATEHAQIALEAGGLAVNAVRGGDGAPISFHHDGWLTVPVVPGVSQIEIDYAFGERASDGWLTTGTTLTWPYHCGNLFPCLSSPAEGIAFSLAVSDPPPGEVLVHPAAVTTEVPAYVVAWASGAYAEVPLGATPAGTALSVWHLPDNETAAAAGTANLVAAFDWLETRLGAYALGAKAGSVEAAWGVGAYGGMEHHPYWHVASGAMHDDTIHVHEAAHGWLGDGVRMACWEDFVLSEGTVSYLTARILADLEGEARGDAIWSAYRTRLLASAGSSSLQIAWPEGCNAIDILADGLLSSVPYMKGAFFFRALEARLGAEAVVTALAAFYSARVGTAATMQDLLDTIFAETGYDPTACATAWLRQEAIPDEEICP